MSGAMRAAFLRCMKLQYPMGPASAYQHRDLIRCFSTGWVEALKDVDNCGAVQDWMNEYAATADPNWWPGREWQWW